MIITDKFRKIVELIPETTGQYALNHVRLALRELCGFDQQKTELKRWQRYYCIDDTKLEYWLSSKDAVWCRKDGKAHKTMTGKGTFLQWINSGLLVPVVHNVCDHSYRTSDSVCDICGMGPNEHPRIGERIKENMKIIVETKEKSIPFTEIVLGTCFYYNNLYYMKIQVNGVTMAASLVNGYTTIFEEKLVIPVDCEIKILAH